MLSNENVFKTSSLNIASWLLVKEVEPLDYITVKGVTTFFYERSDVLDKYLTEYDNNVELKKFIGKFRQVREMVKIK
jgi:hypothetical protein